MVAFFVDGGGFRSVVVALDRLRAVAKIRIRLAVLQLQSVVKMGLGRGGMVASD